MAVRDLDRELIVATRNGNLDLVKELVEKDKANVNCQVEPFFSLGCLTVIFSSRVPLVGPHCMWLVTVNMWMLPLTL